MSFINALILSTIFLTLVSCGKSSTSGPAVIQQPEVRPVVQREEDDHGMYTSELLGMNGVVAGEARGKFTFKIKSDDVMVEVEMNGVHGGIKHFQSVHAGTCPTEDADINLDGVIDAREALPFIGATLIPLDSDLNTQIEGISYGPIANEESYYFYRRSTSFIGLMSDLTAPDNDEEDSLIKLKAGARLKLSERIIVVYGVSAETPLPDSVASVQDLSVHQSLPVACGKLVRTP